MVVPKNIKMGQVIDDAIRAFFKTSRHVAFARTLNKLVRILIPIAPKAIFTSKVLASRKAFHRPSVRLD
jgi:hypothetical protein